MRWNLPISVLIVTTFLSIAIPSYAQPIRPIGVTSNTEISVNQPLVPLPRIEKHGEIIEELELFPAPDAEVILWEVKATVFDSGRLRLSGSNPVFDNDPLTGYRIEVNIEEGLYKTTFLPEEKLADIKRQLSLTDSRPSHFSKDPVENAALMSPFYFRYYMSVISEDIVNIALARTTAEVYWNDDGNQIQVTSTPLAFWAATTPFFDTHWFISAIASDMKYPHDQYSFDNELWAKGNYYNYDFLDDDEITTAEQFIELDIHVALPSGQVGVFNWYVDYDGEWSGWLFSDVINYLNLL